MYDVSCIHALSAQLFPQTASLAVEPVKQQALIQCRKFRFRLAFWGMRGARTLSASSMRPRLARQVPVQGRGWQGEGH
jgi:hypothetical protein